MINLSEEPKNVSAIGTYRHEVIEELNSMLVAADRMLKLVGSREPGADKPAIVPVQVDDDDYINNPIYRADAFQLYVDLGLVSLQHTHVRSFLRLLAAQGKFTEEECNYRGTCAEDYGDVVLRRAPAAILTWLRLRAGKKKTAHPLTRMYRDIWAWVDNIAENPRHLDENSIVRYGADDEAGRREIFNARHFFAQALTHHLDNQSCCYNDIAGHAYLRLWPVAGTDFDEERYPPEEGP